MSDLTEQIALVINGEDVLMPVEEAKERYALLESKRLAGASFTDEDNSYHAALTLSLGTMFDLEQVRKDWEATGNKWEGPI